MRSLAEMENDEILALTDEDILVMAKYRCAEEGVVIAVEPSPVVPRVVESTICFEICGIYTSDHAFAIALQNFLTENRVKIQQLGYWNYSSVVNTRKLEPIRTVPSIERQEYLTEIQYLRSKEDLDHNAEASKQYDDAKTKWANYKKKLDEFTKPIRERRDEIKAEKARIADYVKQMKTYLELADGEQHIAKRFFEKAFPSLSSDTKKQVYEICGFPQVTGGRVV